MSTDTTTANGQVVADRNLDLAAARRARAEKRGKPPTVSAFGQTWTLPASLPADVFDRLEEVAALAEAMERGDMGSIASGVKLLRVLLGGPVYDQLKQAAVDAGEPLDLDDITDLTEHVMGCYGMTVPESSGSGDGS